MECVAQNRIVPRTGTMGAGGVDNAEGRRLNQLGQLISSLQHIPTRRICAHGPNWDATGRRTADPIRIVPLSLKHTLPMHSTPPLPLLLAHLILDVRRGT